MPDDHAVANFNAINMPDTINEFDILLPEAPLTLALLQAPASVEEEAPPSSQSLNVAASQDITLEQTFALTFSAGADEEIRDMFGIAVDPTTNPEEDQWNLDFGLDPEPPRNDEISANDEDSMEIEVGRDAMRDRSFSPILQEESFGDIETGLVDPTAEKDAGDTSFQSIHDPPMGDGDSLSMGPRSKHPSRPGEDDLFPGVDIQLPELDQPNDAGDENLFPTPADVTAREPAEHDAESAGLEAADPEPSVQTAVQQAKKKAQARKRKWIVDDEIELPGKSIQEQLRDTSDICRNEQYVPISRQMQRFAEIRSQGVAYFLDNHPDDMPPELQILFANRWRDVVPVVDPVTDSPRVSPKKRRRAASTPNEEREDSKRLDDAPIHYDEPRDDFEANPATGDDNSFNPPTFDDTLTFDDPLAHATDDNGVPDGLLDLDAAREEFELGLLRDGEAVKKRRRGGVEEEPLEDENTEEANADEALIDEPDIFNFDESADTPNENGLSRSTVRTIKVLQASFGQQETAGTKTVRYSDMTASARRPEAVRFFFELLVLKTKNMVDVKQEEAFGDIEISPKDGLYAQNLTGSASLDANPLSPSLGAH
ncbi:hypothetical protein BDK51DRAFT_32011 [Blyttiomyces helicus]|uniref:Rad21/Rec8-like protein C-terminal eukaryotic domain-containing protein n=1 Tax=Blyttiomyces helicus TaxID=388810 RepID=A0A4P9W1H5_9FUNG|nr:hypothetical protein BDK51DRAFT_32011 [Blyttiomyces helicus]|eukprot:RKO86029.1 hypothetical protein BDK51DRAFT_32011 [Blyttiomyces helicus]